MPIGRRESGEDRIRRPGQSPGTRERHAERGENESIRGRPVRDAQAFRGQGVSHGAHE